MKLSLTDLLNLLALLLNGLGSFFLYYYGQKVNSQTILYMKSEMPKIKERDAFRNKMIQRGMLLLFLGMILQAISIYLKATFDL